MEHSRSLTTFHDFYRQHRPWSRSLLRQALADTGVDWEEHWNQAWAKFSQNYLDEAFTFRTSPEAYLHKILANQVIDALRQHKREIAPLLLGEREELLEDMSTAVDGTLELLSSHAMDDLSVSDWQDPELAVAMTRLSPMQRSVIVFWAWREPPPTDREIGSEFGISTSAAKTHRNRALDRLRAILSIQRLDSRDVREEIT
jgi:RNA polymerase sigma factor (sigma-70 family)